VTLVGLPPEHDPNCREDPLLASKETLGRRAHRRALVLQAPAPVVAQALGYHDKTASRLVTEAGGTWSRYAGGDHTR